jgi:hypothetical protein
MNRIELYKKTVDTLLDAYNDGTLFHGNCFRCAVGNICGSSAWSAKFVTQVRVGGEVRQVCGNLGLYSQKEVVAVIKNSGYSEGELKRIEFSFESSIAHDYLYLCYSEPKKGQYIGLCAVLRVLQEIHETEKEDHEESIDRLDDIYNHKLVETIA